MQGRILFQPPQAWFCSQYQVLKFRIFTLGQGFCLVAILAYTFVPGFYGLHLYPISARDTPHSRDECTCRCTPHWQVHSWSFQGLINHEWGVSLANVGQRCKPKWLQGKALGLAGLEQNPPLQYIFIIFITICTLTLKHAFN